MLVKVFMSRRAVIILASLWTFLVVPNLCTTGMLTHACGKHASDGCGHESDCNDDPCAKFTPAGLMSFRATWLDSAHQPVAVILPNALADGNLPAPHLIPQPHPPRGTAPAPGNHLPLLI